MFKLKAQEKWFLNAYIKDVSMVELPRLGGVLDKQLERMISGYIAPYPSLTL
jgi:hypothetical protein